MKVRTLLIIAAVVIIGATVADRVRAAEPTLTDTLDANGVDYMTLFARSPRTLAVFGDTDVKQMCELADNYPDANVEEVWNVNTNSVAKCGIVQADINSL